MLILKLSMVLLWSVSAQFGRGKPLVLVEIKNAQQGEAFSWAS
jgi:hypothetical protein